MLKSLISKKAKINQVGIKGYIGKEEIKDAKRQGITLGELTENWSWSRPGLAKELMDAFCNPYIQDGDKIVEIGTGSGKHSIEILKKFPNIKYLSYEPSEELENYLKDLFKNYNFKNMPTSGYKLDGVEDESVDLIHANGVFVYIEQQYTYSYFEEARKKLKKGGYFVFDIHNSENKQEGFVDHVIEYTQNLAGRVLNQASYIERHLKAMGFEKIDIQDGKKDLNYRTYMVFQKVR